MRATRFIFLRLLPVITVGLLGAVSVRADATPVGKLEGNVRVVTFGDLRFTTTPPKQVPQEGKAGMSLPSFDDQIPDNIRALHKQRVRVRGYMMPTVLEGNGVREFIIVSNTLACCFGQTPDINEYLVVRVVGKPAPLLENVPLNFEGIIRIGDIYQDGYWTGIYALECDSVKA